VQVAFMLTVVAMTLGWHALVALFASHTAVRARFQAALHWVERVTGAVLIALGVRLALTRVSS
ncbi:MAG: LysE family translocator, partial [Chloroflexia bacterium]|nr:LysE family translocator [Chloroflexia bacterium]